MGFHTSKSETHYRLEAHEAITATEQGRAG